MTTTEYAYAHWRSVEHQDYIIFDTQAKSDLHIALSPFMQWKGPGYELVIGGWYNSKSVIRDGATQTHYEEVETKGKVPY